MKKCLFAFLLTVVVLTCASCQKTRVVRERETVMPSQALSDTTSSSSETSSTTAVSIDDPFVEEKVQVLVVIPEGSTIDQIADILENKNVCTATEFYDTVQYGNFENYDFIAELTPDQRSNRVYLLEGYLFPDTYAFYEQSSADVVVRAMLDNFDSRIHTDIRTRIRESGKTLNEVLIEASIIQCEAGFTEDMPRVARVIANRLADPFAFPKLQMSSTLDYIDHVESKLSKEVLYAAYNTYEIDGLPVGTICNPGLAAINAALHPSTEAEIVNCFYFESISDTGEMRFFETLIEFEAWLIENAIGIHG